MEEMETYISRRQNKVKQSIATRPIPDLCLEAKRRTGAQVAKRWWLQDGIDLTGVQGAAAAAGRLEEAEGLDYNKTR